MSIELKITDRSNVAFPIIIRDTRGNKIYEQWASGYWCVKTYDDNGNELTCKHSNGFHYIKGKDVTQREYEAFINNKTMSNKQKPPLGLMPYSIFLLRRLEDIFQAIERYYEGNIQIPIEWIKEYNLLIEMYKNNLGKDEQ